MNVLLLAASAFAGALSGFAALSLAMDRHHEDAYGRGSTPGLRRHWLRATGAALLLSSLFASLRVQGTAQGWVLWCGILTVAALVVVGTATYRPRRAFGLGVVGAMLAVLGWMLAY